MLLFSAAMCAALCYHATAVQQPAPKQQQQAYVQTVRRVSGQTLTSSALPAARITFDAAFKHVGSQKFILYERALAEQHYFVDADPEGRIRRMYMLQFEGFLPNVTAAYDYKPTKTIKVGGQEYVTESAIVPSVVAVFKRDPQSDAARAVRYLEGQGYRAGDEVMFQRFVRLLDDAKRNEFIVIYIEDMSATGRKASELLDETRAAERDKVLQGLTERALKGFTISKYK
ncbi:MAG: hypothetical protein ACRD9R_12710 [Pyrinomonadaceae bacterium]